MDKLLFQKSYQPESIQYEGNSEKSVGNRPMTLHQTRTNIQFCLNDRPRTSSSPRIAKLQSIYENTGSRLMSTSTPIRPQSNRTVRTTVRPLSAVILSSSREEYTPIRLIEKLVNSLSPELRNNILEIANMLSASEKISKDTSEGKCAEVLELRAANDKTNVELQNALNECEILRSQAAEQRNFTSSVESKIDDKEKDFSKSLRSISKLMRRSDLSVEPQIIPESSALESCSEKLQSSRKHHDICVVNSEVIKESSLLEGVAANASLTFSATTGRASSSRRTAHHRKAASNFSYDELGDIPKSQIDPSMKDEKLRNSLLKMSRDKYRMAKKVEILGNEVEILKTKLDMSELKCRHLQIDLAEVRGTDDTAPLALSFVGTSQPYAKVKDFGPVDEIFKMMIERRAYNPVESVLQFRRIVEVMSSMPGNLRADSVGNHMCSNRMIQILDVDMICVFITDFNHPTRVRKHTIRSDKSEEFELSSTPSLVAEVLQKRTYVKHSDVTGTSFNTKIDGCVGVVVRNILSVPLLDSAGRCMGVIHLLNKFEGKVGFTELDELFASVYAEMAVSTLLGCRKLQHVSFRADVLTAILGAPLFLLQLLPDAGSQFIKRILPHEVLRVLENCAQNALRCFKVKAFLLSPEGCILSSHEKTVTSSNATRDNQVLLQFPIHTGLVGFVMGAKKWVVNPPGEIDLRINPDVDVDAVGMPCVTAPILNIKGEVIACLQMVCGHGSPKNELVASRADGLTFEQAAGHLINCLSYPLQSVLDAMKEETKPIDVKSQISLALKSLQENTHAPIRSQNSDEIAKYVELRQNMGYLEIEKTVVDDYMKRLKLVTEENEDFRKTSTTLQRDLTATQMLYQKERNLLQHESKDESAAAEAREIAGRIRMKKSHSRRLSFS